MNKKYTDNQKLYLISRYYNGEPATDICIKEGIPRRTFYTWIKSYNTKISNFECDISVTEFYKLKQKVMKFEQIIEVLQTVECTANAPLKERLYALENLNDKFPINILYELLMVNRSIFYNHILRNKKQNNSYKECRKKLQEQILEIYEDSNQIYDAKKIKAVIESFFSFLKKEELYRRKYRSIKDFNNSIKHYIGFYNMNVHIQVLNLKLQTLMKSYFLASQLLTKLNNYVQNL